MNCGNQQKPHYQERDLALSCFSEEERKEALSQMEYIKKILCVREIKTGSKMTVLSLSEGQKLQWDIFTKQIKDNLIF